MEQELLPITNIQKFCTQDGPGIRTTIFFKGCPLRCVWCHNPETQSVLPEYFYTDRFCIHCDRCVSICPAGAHQIVNGTHLIHHSRCTHCMHCTTACPTGALEPCLQKRTVEELYQEILKDRDFYGKTGGVTLSGGEPMLYARPAARLLRQVKAADISTAIETCGFFDSEMLSDIVPFTDLFLWDVKDTDEERHLANTGASFRKIVENLRLADSLGAATRLRCILIRSVNLNETHLTAIARLYESLRHCQGVELLPYHAYGEAKYAQLGRDGCIRRDWIPTAAELTKAKKFLRKYVPLIT